MSRTLQIKWQETASQLKQKYRQEGNAERKTRLYALWQLRLGKSLKKVTELVGFTRIFLPPYSPELNPCERVFEWLRSKIEGEVYASLQHKRHTITQYLRFLTTHKAALQSLGGWNWIQDAFGQLST